MTQDLLNAIALMLVIEGIMPFLNPNVMRRVMFQIVQQNDKTLRIAGLATMAAGVVLLYLARLF